MNTDTPEGQSTFRPNWGKVVMISLGISFTVAVIWICTVSFIDFNRSDKEWRTAAICQHLVDFAQRNPGQDVVPGELLVRCAPLVEIRQSKEREREIASMRKAVTFLWENLSD